MEVRVNGGFQASESCFLPSAFRQENGVWYVDVEARQPSLLFPDCRGRVVCRAILLSSTEAHKLPHNVCLVAGVIKTILHELDQHI